ncbi:hypothetical protein IWW50_005561 [Coemansia erecta]|nr:hypothetical protein GGF43_002754 [Coemansia sp. RSA 2618]KAJ2819152.1 hypothetical protein IWW50_005561 [Coemansia erecta]
MAVIDIYISRHGQTDANASALMQGGLIDPPLNEVGIRQAEALASAMKGENLDLVVASGLERSIKTVKAVVKHQEHAEYLSDPRLNDISWGELEGAKAAEVKPEVNEVIQAWKKGNFDAKVRGGESPNEVKARFLAAFTDMIKIAQEKKYSKVFTCIHGRIMRVIMATLIDKDLLTMQRFSHTNCCYHHLRVEVDDDTVVDPENLKFELVRMDVRDHLAELAEVEPTDCRQL